MSEISIFASRKTQWPFSLDTNVLVYAEDADSAGKQVVAAALVAECYLKGDAVISTQVMMEYYNVAVKN